VDQGRDLVCFETGSHNVVQAGLRLLILPGGNIKKEECMGDSSIPMVISFIDL
jgi:hypothetical protein